MPPWIRQPLVSRRLLPVACAVLVSLLAGPRQMAGMEPDELPASPLRVRFRFFQCVDPPEPLCMALSESAKATKCPSCKRWEERGLALQGMPRFRPEPYRGTANLFLRDVTESLYGVPFPTKQGQPVQVADLYSRPAKYGWVEIPSDKVPEGALAVWKSSLGGLVVADDAGGSTPDLQVSFPSHSAGGRIRSSSLAALRQDVGKPKFLLPRALFEEAFPASAWTGTEPVEAIQFGRNSDRLDAAALIRLEMLANTWKKNPTSIIKLSGYTDPLGSAEHNQILAERRVENARSYLALAGVNPSLVRTVSVGESGGECSPGNEECLQESRRVEAKITFPPAEYWNAWAEPFEGDTTNVEELATELRYAPVDHLLPNRRYLIALHLSGYPYRTEAPAWSLSVQPASSDLGKILDERLRKRAVKTWNLRAIVMPGPLFRTTPTVLEDLFVVHLDRVLAFREQAKEVPEDLLAELDRRRESGEAAPAYVFGQLPFILETGELTGPTSVGVSIWDELHHRPIDEIRIPLCIGESPEACPTKAPVFGLAGPGLVDLATQGVPAELPDASLHLFELPSRVVGVFHRRDRTCQDFQVCYPAWTASTSPAKFKDSLRNLQSQFGQKGKDPLQIGYGAQHPALRRQRRRTESARGIPRLRLPPRGRTAFREHDAGAPVHPDDPGRGRRAGRFGRLSPRDPEPQQDRERLPRLSLQDRGPPAAAVLCAAGALPRSLVDGAPQDASGGLGLAGRDEGSWQAAGRRDFQRRHDPGTPLRGPETVRGVADRLVEQGRNCRGPGDPEPS